jgi:hypothetical protein
MLVTGGWRKGGMYVGDMRALNRHCGGRGYLARRDGTTFLSQSTVAITPPLRSCPSVYKFYPVRPSNEKNHSGRNFGIYEGPNRDVAKMTRHSTATKWVPVSGNCLSLGILLMLLMSSLASEDQAGQLNFRRRGFLASFNNG